MEKGRPPLLPARGAREKMRELKGDASSERITSLYYDRHRALVESDLREAVIQCIDARAPDPLAFLIDHLQASSRSVDDTEKNLELAVAAAKAALASVVVDSTPNEWRLKDWFESLELHSLLVEGLCQPIAHLLAEATPMQRCAVELAYLRALGRHADMRLLQFLMQGGQGRLAKTLLEAMQQVVHRPATATELSVKFVQAGELHYGSLEQFHGGIHEMVGAPNPNLHEAMLDEHSRQPDSHVPFVTGNYGESHHLIPSFPHVCEPHCSTSTGSYTHHLVHRVPIRVFSCEGPIHTRHPALSI